MPLFSGGSSGRQTAYNAIIILGLEMGGSRRKSESLKNQEPSGVKSKVYRDDAMEGKERWIRRQGQGGSRFELPGKTSMGIQIQRLSCEGKENNSEGLL